ncbi:MULTISPECIES: type VII secretion target [unclassified Nocardioides]|uniref:type VII secretion target n=1 Tax=unclassified Nocardioides TaxID=2615069 RepID=UPI0026668082|nr:type VII secretion target [Nocardioides sp. Arc9.136]WKN49840.1 type VII secretion target [Nocardioides sp. Arc9.136]
MTSGEIKVVTEAMRSHAGQVEQLAVSAYDGVQAGRDMALDGSAFGVLCSFIGGALAPAQATGIAATGAAVGSLGATALQVRAVAKVFEEVDDVVGSAMDRFRG